jgi:hypothetical protein
LAIGASQAAGAAVSVPVGVMVLRV